MNVKEKLSLSGLTMIAIGACIGSGIFVTPAQSMAALPHHGLVLITWLIGGVISCLGALSFSELGARYPKSGGVYVYLKEAYGELTGFLYGWIILLIVNTGALAALSITLVDYALPLLKMENINKNFAAIFVIWILTLINIFGVQISEIFSKVFTGLKLIAIICIILAGWYYFANSGESSELFLTDNIPPDPIQGIFITFIGVFWSMGGWHHATYLSGEADNPQKTVPKAMIYGTLIVTIVYLLVIMSYMFLLDTGSMMESKRVASDALTVVWKWGATFVSYSIVISILGTIGIYTMTAPRIYFAMARDKIFFPFLADISPKFGTPWKAMIFQSVWASVLILFWGSFIKVITFVTFMDIVFMALACSTLFYFRWRKNEESTFRVPLYPIVPMLYLLVTLGFVFYTGSQLGEESIVGITILVLGVPFYYIFQHKKKK
ncbi:MAG: amino acid permease [Saprospiraceae bacterium]|nr:amino acid permease [Saprospiraceae bacterium]MBK8369846.1 amino acid permease [Saprospiraceae bacterium]MBK8819221.1 amino acid permease [Saprospiraceae bacterium]